MAAEAHARDGMTDAAPGAHPEPGDLVVFYEPRTLHGNPRLALARWTAGGTPALIRATFESAEDAGPRFEEEARLIASECAVRSFRCVDGRYTLLPATADPPS